MSDKIAQTHIYRDDGVYFVSTINRQSSSALAPDMWYAETMAWGPASTNHLGIVGWPDGRGPMVFQDSAGDGHFGGHVRVCQMIHQYGKDAQTIADKEAEHE